MAQSITASFVELIPSPPFAEQALQLAIELGHPVYDCFFLAMCEATERQLVTADLRLIDRCAGTRFHQMLRTL